MHPITRLTYPAFLMPLVLVASFVGLVGGPPYAAHATQAYGDGWSASQTGNPDRPAMVWCATDGRDTRFRTAGRQRFSVEKVRIIPGRQDIDNVIRARSFRLLRHATEPGSAFAHRVASCQVRTVKGVRRAMMTTRSGERWALISPYAGKYYREYWR